jgi:exodeoxyribonuclease VII large subunit
MLLKVAGAPQLHPQFGFSLTISSIQLAGEGSIKKAAQLLQAQLTKEGLFDPSRKRALPYPPTSVGLITSGESAAFVDFTKILNQRWGGMSVRLYDVQVQGEDAPAQIVNAIEYFNSHATPPEVLVITRGGGSADDLQAFNTETVTRTVAASRIPTLVAIGHEVDVSLAELAADTRASTPSNAAELLVPDKIHELVALESHKKALNTALDQKLQLIRDFVSNSERHLQTSIEKLYTFAKTRLEAEKRTLGLLNPQNILKRGYALVYRGDTLVKSVQGRQAGEKLSVKLADGTISTTVTSTEP